MNATDPNAQHVDTDVDDQDIRELSFAAGQANNGDLHRLCRLALAGDPDARTDCERRIIAARQDAQR